MTAPACFWTAVLAALLGVVVPAAAQHRDDADSGSPLDQLRPENIPEYERRIAAERNGGTLPEGLVAILGDSRWQHTPYVLDIAVTPDGTQCVTAGGTSLVLWDLHTGEALRVMPCASGQRMLTLSMSGDGRTVAAGGINSEVTIWDLPNGRLRHRLATMGGAVALSRDGRSLITGDVGVADISIWDAAAGQLQRELSSDPKAFPELKHLSIAAWRVAINPAGTVIASAHAMMTKVPERPAPQTTRIVLWDVQSGLPLHVLEGDLGHEARSVEFSDDSESVAACGTNGHVRLWRVSDGHPLWDCRPDPNPDAWAYDVQFSPGGRFVWVLTSTSIIPIDIRVGRAGTPVAVPRGTACFDFLPDGEHVVIACGGPRLLDLRTGQVEFPLESTAHAGNLISIAFAAGGRQLATSGDDGLIILWDLPGGRPRHRLEGHETPVRALAYSPDGSLLASGDEQGTLNFWETATGRLIETRPGPHSSLRIAFDADGRLLANAASDGTVDVWDLGEWKLIRSVKVRHKSQPYVAFVPDSRLLLTSTGVVDIDSGDLIPAVSPREPIIAASPDCALVLGKKEVRNLIAGEPLAALDFPGYLCAATFSPDGRRIAAINSAGRLFLWDANSGEALWLEQVAEALSFSGTLTFSHDGRYLAYPAGNGTVHIIRIPLP